MEEVTTVAGVNTRIPHLEGDTIFGSTKRKLNLPPGDDSDSHRHDLINFFVPKLGKQGCLSRRHDGVMTSRQTSLTRRVVTDLSVTIQ